MIINADNDIDRFFDVVADTKGCGRKYVDAVVDHSFASQFTSWRDRGVPVEPGHLVQLVQVTPPDHGLYQEHPKHHHHHHDQLNNVIDITIAADASAEPSWSKRRSRREGSTVVGSL